MYKRFVKVCVDQPGFKFCCFIADRSIADPIERFGDAWTAYQRMAGQLILGSVARDEILSVLADNYSTPANVHFEEDVKEQVNRRLSRLAVATVVRLDSRSSDGLQVVDLFTSAAAFEFRAAAGLTTLESPKAKLAAFVREALGVESFLGGWREGGHSVRIYDHGRWNAALQTDEEKA